MKRIFLINGGCSVVDDEDFEWLSQWEWHATKMGDSIYATRTFIEDDGIRRIRRVISVHRAILKAPPGTFVDHIDGNGLNNRRNNLRLCTRAENNRNTPLRRDNTSGFKGVTRNKQRDKWMAKIKFNNNLYYLGFFADPVEAARAYDRAAKKFHGEFARLNFPEAN